MPRPKRQSTVDVVSKRVAALKAGTQEPIAGAADYTPSAINLPRSDWKFLRKVAEARADRQGGRPSVSKVIKTLIDERRKELEEEILT